MLLLCHSSLVLCGHTISCSMFEPPNVDVMSLFILIIPCFNLFSVAHPLNCVPMLYGLSSMESMIYAPCPSAIKPRVTFNNSYGLCQYLRIEFIVASSGYLTEWPQSWTANPGWHWDSDDFSAHTDQFHPYVVGAGDDPKISYAYVPILCPWLWAYAPRSMFGPLRVNVPSPFILILLHLTLCSSCIAHPL